MTSAPNSYSLYTKAQYDANYNSGVSNTKVGTAVAANVLSGKTFTNSSGVGISGTMKNNGAWTSNPGASGKVTIPAGYHNGSGYVDTTSVYNAGVAAGKTSPKTVIAKMTVSDINNSHDKGINFYVNGIYIGGCNIVNTNAYGIPSSVTKTITID